MEQWLVCSSLAELDFAAAEARDREYQSTAVLLHYLDAVLWNQFLLLRNLRLSRFTLAHGLLGCTRGNNSSQQESHL